ncbi:SAM-dependent methyltransferase [uncultured Roseobacter sp.]|uniref:class I SAM-dependent methyltransferase n=1 Tax=uncultured Roseobacter sp. TaxID=114847 RepID=UPI0026321181|nr:SAM-dependent methyltransferase [uncultured Roseobacter sp.]
MSLRAELLARIAANGPLSVAEYMQECLLHPRFGYYTTREPFGSAGDFVTAPEISQMFGELVGLCLAQAWADQGRPAAFTLAEAGPGRGTLMADILRAAGQLPGFREAANVVLIEASDRLRNEQRRTLEGIQLTFVNTCAELPDAPLFFVANEFFDALPIRQFQRDQTHWRERQIGEADGDLCFGLGPLSPQPALAGRLDDTVSGDLVEYCPAAAPAVDATGRRIAEYGGAGLIIDYGDWRSLGDTLQALKSRSPVDPLASPGEADLTAHVDFEALSAAAPCACTRVTPQGIFLERLGITARAQALASRLSGAALEQHIAAHRRLTHPQEMGNLFKVLGLFPHAGTPPPGLEV